jgi:glycosyltransferase involved in cell wall biosynthesis
MRVLFLVSDNCWSASARAFVLAARGLAAKGHDVVLACQTDCPVQVRAGEAAVPVIKLEPDASAAGSAWMLRKTVQERDVDVVFVHTDQELLIASSAMRLGRGAGTVIQRVPPFAIASPGRGSRLATRIAPTGLLFSTEADRQAADVKRYRVPSAVAPLAVDPTVHEAVRETSKASLGAPPNSLLIVCIHDGRDKRRVFTALRTLALLAPRHPELHLAVVGAARLDELRMHGAALGINSMVSYIGERDDELSIIRAANVGWIAADGDAAAFAALDFMAFRIPALAERHPLTEHYVADGIAGLLLAPADPTTTAASVAAFLAKDEQRVQMGNAGRARLQREFSYEAMIRGFEQAISGAMERPARPARPAPPDQPAQPVA